MDLDSNSLIVNCQYWDNYSMLNYDIWIELLPSQAIYQFSKKSYGHNWSEDDISPPGHTLDIPGLGRTVPKHEHVGPAHKSKNPTEPSNETLQVNGKKIKFNFCYYLMFQWKIWPYLCQNSENCLYFPQQKVKWIKLVQNCCFHFVVVV